MELVYLWVENYKNIHHQGFNFSPRFHCEYNDKTKELTITENDDYISDFFGEDINVTAIVGKNGSGKSNILKSLFQNDDNSSAKEKLWYLLYNNGLSIYFIDNMGIHENKDIQKNSKYNIEELKKKSIQPKINFSMIYFSNIFQYLPVHDDKQDRSFYNISTSYLINRYSKKLNNSSNFKSQYNYYKSKAIEQTITMLQDTNLKLNFDLPKELNIVTQGGYPTDEYNKMEKILKKEEDILFKLRVKYNIIYNYIFNYLDDEEVQKLLNSGNKKTIEDFYEEIKIELPFDNEVDDFLNLLDNPNFIMTSIKIKDINDIFIEKLKSFNKVQAFSLNLLDVLTFNWKPELSSGQEAFLFQFAQFYNILKNGNNIKRDIIILIDEGETTMHPDWQKQYIKWYIDFFLKNFKDNNFHLIFTTHSPFLLSDIPKENIVFLNGSLKEKQTFGANIHTLLSDSFFMKNGLMGEFAKSKINEIKEFHTKVIKEKKTDENIEFYNQNKDKFWQIQEIIGEPFLQKIVKNQLEEIELILLGRDEAIDKEIARLQALKASIKNA